MSPWQVNVTLTLNLTPNPYPNPYPNQVNVTLGPEMAITASGTGRATELPDRVDHQTLTDCHVLATAGQLVPKGERNSTQLAGKVARPIGGVWQTCTRNEWTLSTPDMIVDVGVIGIPPPTTCNPALYPSPSP